MRYRPFKATGGSVSAITLAPVDPALTDDEREALFQAALFAGVNAYEVDAADAASLTLLGDALRSYDRDLVKVSVRVGRSGGGSARDFSPAMIMGQVERATRALDLGALDMVMLDAPEVEDLTPSLVDTLRQAYRTRAFSAVGVRAEGAAAEALVRCGAFQVLSTRFNLLSGWPERNLIRLAVERGLIVTGYGYTGDELHPDEDGAAAKPKRGLFGLGRKKQAASELTRSHGYTFLTHTQGWSDEEICLAYALTEPSLASVQVDARSAEQLQRLASVPERDLPASLTAQIEMARFAAVA